MNYRTTSLVTLFVLLLIGIMFFALSYNLPLTEPSMVIGSGYYPRVLSIILIFGCVVGIVNDFRDKKGREISIAVENPKFFFLILAFLAALTAIWQFTRSFYPVTGIVVIILLWMLNPEQASVRKALKSIGIAAAILGFIYVIFTMMLQLNL